MAGKSYTINVKIVTNSAPVAARAVSDLKTIETQSVKSATKVESETKKIAVGYANLAMKGVQLQERLAKSQEDAAVKAVTTADKKAKDITSIEDRYLKADWERRVAYERRKEQEAERTAAGTQRRTTKLYTQEEALARAKTEVIRRQNDQMVKSELELMGVTTRRHANGWEGANKLISSTISLGASYASLNTGLDVLKNIGDAAKEAADSQKRMTDEYLKYRDAQREQLDMQNKGVTKKSVLDAAEFEAETGMTASEAKSFNEAFQGSGAQFEDKLGKDAFKRLRTQAANLAVGSGIEPGVMGDLAGSLAGTRDYASEAKAKGTTPDRLALADFNQVMAILKSGKGGNASNAKQATMISSFALNPDETLGTFSGEHAARDMAAATSVAAEVNPQEAEVFVRNAIKAIRPKEKDKSQELMKKAGVTPQTKFFEAYEKIAPVILKEAREQKIDIGQVLQGYDYDVREAKAMGAFINKGVMGGTIAKRIAVGDANATPEVAERAILEARANQEASVSDRRSIARKRLMEMRRGGEEAPVATLKRDAETALGERGQETSSWSDLTWNTLGKGGLMSFGMRAMTGGLDSLELRKSAEMESIVQRRAKQQGIKLAARPEMIGVDGNRMNNGMFTPGEPVPTNEAGRSAYFRARAKEFKDQGGSIIEDLTKEMLMELRKGNAPGAPQPMPVNFRNAVNSGMLRW